MSTRAGAMTPEQFVEMWSKAAMNERQSSQEDFIDPRRLHLKIGSTT
jgi:hypothetical protein